MSRPRGQITSSFSRARIFRPRSCVVHRVCLQVCLGGSCRTVGSYGTTTRQSSSRTHPGDNDELKKNVLLTKTENGNAN